MQNFYDKFTFILAFMIFILLFNMVFGAKPTEYFLIIVLLGMVFTNSENVKNLFAKLEG